VSCEPVRTLPPLRWFQKIWTWCTIVLAVHLLCCRWILDTQTPSLFVTRGS
jgi:hypothetical protein